MVCSLHSVTTGSRDRANVSLIIIIYNAFVLLIGVPENNNTIIVTSSRKIKDNFSNLSVNNFSNLSLNIILA